MELTLQPQVELRGAKMEGLVNTDGRVEAVIERDEEGIIVMDAKSWGEAWSLNKDGSLTPVGTNSRIEAKRWGGQPSPRMRPIIETARRLTA